MRDFSNKAANVYLKPDAPQYLRDLISDSISSACEVTGCTDCQHDRTQAAPKPDKAALLANCLAKPITQFARAKVYSDGFIAESQDKADLLCNAVKFGDGALDFDRADFYLLDDASLTVFINPKESPRNVVDGLLRLAEFVSNHWQPKAPAADCGASSDVPF